MIYYATLITNPNIDGKIRADSCKNQVHMFQTERYQ